LSIKGFLETSWDQFLSDLDEFISIESIEGEPLPGAPFGPGPAAALSWYLSRARSFGFHTSNFDGFAGEVLWDPFETGNAGIGVIVHVDVVPAYGTWSVPPFRLSRNEGKLFGRGVFDDKGPALGILYALAALREEGFLPFQPIRIILGTNEESGMQGIAEYRRRRPDPHLSFTPDAPFPVVRGEKGILDCEFVWELSSSHSAEDEDSIVLLELENGPDASVRSVPAFCRMLLSVPCRLLDDFRGLVEQEPMVDFAIPNELKPCRVELRFSGVAAPSTTPWLGVNALVAALSFLDRCAVRIPLASPFDRIAAFGSASLLEQFHGEGLGLGELSDESGKVSCNPGLACLQPGRFSIAVQLRYPISASPDFVTGMIRRSLEKWGGHVLPLRHLPPISFPEGLPLVGKLLASYRSISGDISARPVIMSGGTYARAMSNCVGFGPLFPGSELTAHKADEYITEADLLSAVEIWSDAVMTLCMG